MILFIIAIILSFMHMFIKFFRQNDNATLKAAINLQLKPCARLTEQNFHECTEPYDIALIETFTQNCGRACIFFFFFDFFILLLYFFLRVTVVLIVMYVGGFVYKPSLFVYIYIYYIYMVKVFF